MFLNKSSYHQTIIGLSNDNKNKFGQWFRQQLSKSCRSIRYRKKKTEKISFLLLLGFIDDRMILSLITIHVSKKMNHFYSTIVPFYIMLILLNNERPSVPTELSLFFTWSFLWTVSIAQTNLTDRFLEIGDKLMEKSQLSLKFCYSTINQWRSTWT